MMCFKIIRNHDLRSIELLLFSLHLLHPLKGKWYAVYSWKKYTIITQKAKVPIIL